MLRDLDLEFSYRSGRHQLLRDFYEPCLAVANEYDRAVGYFTSHSLAAAARGLRPFLDHEGRMRLVVSPHLTEEDVVAIASGYRRREAVIEQALVRELDEGTRAPDPIRRRLEFLAWLIATERLDIQVALVENPHGRVGIYHEKVGIFRDAVGDTVVFTGSANESVGGLLTNFESLEVFCSWRDSDAARVSRWRQDFGELWKDSTPGLTIYPFPEAARARLVDQYRPSQPPGDDPERSATTPACMDEAAPFGLPTFPGDLTLRHYQKEAVRAWFAADGRGVWEMATGTGKTITALAATTQVHRRLASLERALAVVVVCPYEHLVNQWADATRWFGIRPIICMHSRHEWMPRLSDAWAGVRSGEVPFAMAISTNKTFSGDAFQAYIAPFSGDLMVIADEVHNLGAPTLRTALPPQARYRLGLSATPERHLDQTGTGALFEYFGPSVFQLGLRQAIEVGALVPYRYYPVQVTLTDEEQARYVELSQRIARLAGAVVELTPESTTGPLQLLLFQRARLIGGAAGKASALAEVMTPLAATAHNLVYCAEGQSGAGDDSQVGEIMRLLGTDLEMRINSYTFETPPADRRERLDRFGSGDLQVLVAIRCLDEGMDVPGTRRGFILASTTNPRQFVQRRGRLLRPAPGKRRAELWDFFVVPPDLSNDRDLFEIERRLVGRELARVVELADAAENGPEALHGLLELRRRYHLLDFGGVETEPLEQRS